MRISMRWLLPAGAIVAAAALVLAWMSVSGTGTLAATQSNSTSTVFHPACGPAQPGHLTCFSIINPGMAPRVVTPNALPPGFGPGGIRGAYNLTAKTAGAGRTVAIVDAFDDPNAESDLAVYRSTYGLPACTTANHCFRKVGEAGTNVLPAANADWAIEISLDLDMVSATCPVCRILLVEANSTTLNDLGSSVNTAIRLGAKFVSNSYGGPEAKGEATKYNHFYNHQGVAVTASAGDSGYGVNFPASSRYVTAVGGTSLHRAKNKRGWSERAWAGTGSGCSRYSGKPGWQPKKSGCPTHRTVGDVSAVADPNTGVALYDTFPDPGVGLNIGWNVAGGTSASSPIIAAVYARAGNPAKNTYPAHYPYKHVSHLWDVIGGHNGTCSHAYLCNAVKGYDGPTGLGTPHTAAGFKY